MIAINLSLNNHDDNHGEIMGGISLQVWAKRERWFRISKADVVRVCVMSFDLGIITVSKVFMNFFEKAGSASPLAAYEQFPMVHAISL